MSSSEIAPCTNYSFPNCSACIDAGLTWCSSPVEVCTTNTSLACVRWCAHEYGNWGQHDGEICPADSSGSSGKTGSGKKEDSNTVTDLIIVAFFLLGCFGFAFLVYYFCLDDTWGRINVHMLLSGEKSEVCKHKQT
jgi:hypothetical protein